jgi:Protein of unknown function (DUF2726)
VNWRARAGPLGSGRLTDDPWPVAAKNLLTEREQSLYLSLLSLYPKHKVFVQVALSQLIDVPEDHPERQSIRNRFSQLVADFVLCHADLSVVAVIELDDRTHLRAERQAADARKNKALADAGLRLVRIPAGRLPSEDFLRALIDADGQLKGGPQESPELSLAEDTYFPERDESTDESSAVSRELKRVVVKALFVVAFLLGGWFFFRQVLPIVIKQAFQPLATTPVRRTSTRQPSLQVISPRIPTAPVVSQPGAEELAEMRQGRSQQAVALKRQKQAAWAAFYSSPASCEHPVDWNAQVDCGNQYMRAKKVFEQKWEAEHPNQGGATDAVLENSSVGGPRK